MSQAWPLVPLGEVLSHYQEYIGAPEAKVYPKLSVKLYGRGVVLDSPADGATLKMKRHQIAKNGQVILSEIWGKKGAIGLVPPEGDGALCTSHFFLFNVRHDRLEPKYLQAIFTANYLQDQLDTEAKGTTGYAAVRPKNLLAARIPLPPLLEQRRIVARIEVLAAKLAEAHGLREQAVQDADRLLVCMAHRRDLSSTEKLRTDWFQTTMSDLGCFTDESESVDGSRSYPNLGIYSYGRGVFPKPPIEGSATSAKTLRRVKTGQFIYSRLFAFEGAYAMVLPEFDNCYVSGEYPTFTCDPTKAYAEFLWAHFRSPSVWQAVAEGSKGLGHRRQRVQPDRVLDYRLWVPPMEWQRKIKAVQAKVDALKKLQAETAAEIDALLPSILDKAFKGELL